MKLIEEQGIKFFVRDESKYDDMFTVNEVVVEDCYKIDPSWFKGNTVIDIGANMGDFSLVCAIKYGVKDVRSFEPEPHNLEIINLNNEINGSPLKVYGVAVGKKGVTCIDNGSGHSQTGRAFGEEVEVMSLNDLDFDRCDVLKIDCEGAEYDIVEDVTNETWDKIDIIVGEFHSWRWEKEPERHERMIKRLEEFFDITYSGYKNSAFWGTKKNV